MIAENAQDHPKVHSEKKKPWKEPFDDIGGSEDYEDSSSKVSIIHSELPLLSGEKYKRFHIRKPKVNVQFRNYLPDEWNSRNPKASISIDRVTSYSFGAGSSFSVDLEPGSHTFAVLSKNSQMLAKPFTMVLEYDKSYKLNFQRDANTGVLTFFVSIHQLYDTDLSPPDTHPHHRGMKYRQ